MRAAHHSFSVSLFVLLMLPLASVIYPAASNADEVQERPWGRLDKPSLSVSGPKRQSGYLGRYNPWSESGANDSDKPPQYRQRGNNDPSSQASGVNPYTGATTYRPAHPYAPMQHYYPSNPMGVDRYSAQPYLPTPGLAPWGGGLDPNYGNYWNDPYDNMQPDRGILWSDMWRR